MGGAQEVARCVCSTATAPVPEPTFAGLAPKGERASSWDSRCARYDCLWIPSCNSSLRPACPLSPDHFSCSPPPLSSSHVSAGMLRIPLRCRRLSPWAPVVCRSLPVLPLRRRVGVQSAGWGTARLTQLKFGQTRLTRGTPDLPSPKTLAGVWHAAAIVHLGSRDVSLGTRCAPPPTLFSRPSSLPSLQVLEP